MAVDTPPRVDVDPVRYEMFRHRLFNILEEGRSAMQLVSGSPVVVEGGECMSSFYDAGGTVILTAAGLLLHCTGCQEAIKRCIEWYEQDPGINEGDQFFFNDPYIAATHVYDMIVIKPIFHGGRRVAWTGAMMHTADTGGVLRGGSSEIFHEGICFRGVKIVEGGHFRPDVFRAITEQCRDAAYVGLDLKARIAANNVCAANYLRLVQKYGLEFVEAASARVIADSEAMARSRLSRLPDGVWRARDYSLNRQRKPFVAHCTMTKAGDEITFDFTGSSAQNPDNWNCTYSCAWSALFVILTGHLFWDVPWNGGMVAPVRLIVPEGSFLNCTYPASCAQGPATGAGLMAAAHSCVARMLYAAGLYEDVNASWMGGVNGERRRFGGHSQFGGVCPQQIYDFFAGGLGAAPYRDGVHSGANWLNPESKISDVELIEMNYPLLYHARRHLRDSAGFGKYRGGVGMDRVMMVYGAQDFTDNYWPPKGIPNGWGMFGGYPSAVCEQIMVHSPQMPELLGQSRYLDSSDKFGPEYGALFPSTTPHGRTPVPEGDVMIDRGDACGGAGYGDPLDRDPALVLQDLLEDVVSPEIAEQMYGVVIRDGRMDEDATAELRRGIREERLRQAKPVG